MSAIIISAVLLMIALTGSFDGFMARSNVLDSELKDRSSAAADACADHAMLLIANDSTYTSTRANPVILSTNNLDSCRVYVLDTGGTKTIFVQATSSKAAVTNLLIGYNQTTAQVTSWQETPMF